MHHSHQSRINQIKAKLRSITPLSYDDLLYISSLQAIEKDDIIILYNEIMIYMVSYIEHTLKDDITN